MVEITIGIPAFINDEKNLHFLELTLKSIKEQTYKDFEILIIDDGSNKKEDVMKLAAKYDARYFYQENKGIGSARQEVIEKANGNYIAFCSHDDIWIKRKLEEQMKIMKEVGDSVLFSDYINIDENGDILNEFKAPDITNIEDFAVACWLWAEKDDMFVNFSTILAPIKFFEEIPFDRSLRASEDLFWILRTCRKFFFVHIKPSMIYYRRHESQQTIVRNIEEIRETNRMIREKARE